MTRSSGISSINCTSCGAGLNVLGGGRVVAHTCSYCGSVLDAQDNYKVLKQFANMERPESPFSIGMTGDIKGVTFTIIGTIGMEERYLGRAWHWTDHMLFSPTHGYAFLTVNKGHLVLTRRYRKPISRDWVSPGMVEQAPSRPSVHSESQTFNYFETSTATITFVEGEFNWQPEMGDTNTTVSLMSDDAKLNFTRTRTEHEVMRSEYLPRQATLDAFGVETSLSVRGVHSLQPFETGPNSKFFTLASLGSMIACLVLTIYVAVMGSFGPRLSQDFQVAALPVEIPVEITEPNTLTRLRLKGNLSNSWAYLTLSVTDPMDEPVFEVGRTIERYSGRQGGERWSEGRGRSSIQFIPRQSGTYKVELGIEESALWGSGGSKLKTVNLDIRQGGVSAAWLIATMVLFGALALMSPLRYLLHRKYRWAGSDWTDED